MVNFRFARLVFIILVFLFRPELEAGSDFSTHSAGIQRKTPGDWNIKFTIFCRYQRLDRASCSCILGELRSAIISTHTLKKELTGHMTGTAALSGFGRERLMFFLSYRGLRLVRIYLLLIVQ
jgi:hypothetical protein